jgi:hypothetical protein
MKQSHPVISSAVIGGAIGLLVALVLISNRSYFSQSPALLLALWPTAIFGIAWNDPPGFTPVNIVMVIILYGGNAFVYAVAASILTGSILAIKGLFNKKDRPPLSIKPD